jgi:diguanylate cyclase (GGDEF)-like protein
VAIAYANIGEVYLALDQREKAIEYSLASVNAAENFTQYSHKIILIIQLINAYLSNAEYDNAIKYCQEALDIALEHGLANSCHRPQMLLACAYLGKYTEEKSAEHLNLAEENLNKVIVQDLSLDYHQQYHLIRGKILLYQDQLPQAEAELQNSLQHGSENAQPLMAIEAYELLADLYSRKADFSESISHLRKASDLEKKLYRDRTNQTISRLKIQYDSIKKEKQLQEEKLRVETLNRNNEKIVALVWGLLIFSILSITVLILVYFLYRSRKLMTIKLNRLARRDPLTGLRNRRAILEDIENETIRFERSKKEFSFILGDLDKFKSINDTYSHDCGDFVLKEVAEIFKNSIRMQDKVCRWGGEEFLFVLPETSGESAMVLAEKLREKVEKANLVWEDKKLQVTISLGVSPYKRDLGSQGGIKKADEAMYLSKKAGRNRVSYQQ